MEMGRTCSVQEGVEKCLQHIFVGRPERKRPLWRPRIRWEYNKKVNVKDIGCENVNWI
jgi:hypothetical protein